MKVIVIGGYPGSGKSTIVKEVLKRLEKEGHKFTIYKHDKLVTYLRSEKGLVVLGTYSPDEKFPGTDRFAMNAQPEAMAFLEEFRDITHEEYVVLFEGDRLFNGKMLDWLYQEGFQRVLCIVQAEQALINRRRQERSKQSETWRKGRQTKVDRIALAYPVAYWLKNNTPEDFHDSVKMLIEEINGTAKPAPKNSTLHDYWK